MYFVGDVHGMMDLFRREMKRKVLDSNEMVIQIGDMGIGFPKSQSHDFPKRSKFIRGNHDNPAICRQHPNYLGDYGTIEVEGHRIFFLGGAWSIDRAMRTEGVSWWPEEELTIAELNQAMEMYCDYKPEIVITHDGPSHATTWILNRYSLSGAEPYREQSPFPTRTGQALSAMFEAYQPKLWVFGHWHVSWAKRIKGTVFMCLNEMEFQKFDEINFGA